MRFRYLCELNVSSPSEMFLNPWCCFWQNKYYFWRLIRPCPVILYFLYHEIEGFSEACDASRRSPSWKQRLGAAVRAVLVTGLPRARAPVGPPCGAL